MTKNTKLLLAGAGIVALFVAYKKGLFGSKTPSGNSTDAPATFDVVVPADAETVTVTPTGDPQGVIMNLLPNNFSQMAPISEGGYA